MVPAELLRRVDLEGRLHAQVLAPPEVWMERTALDVLTRVFDYGVRLGQGDLHASIQASVTDGTPILTLDLRAHPPVSHTYGTLVLERHLAEMMGGELVIEASRQEIHLRVRVPTLPSREAHVMAAVASVRIDEDVVDLVEQFFAEHRARLEPLALELDEGRLDGVHSWSRQLVGSGASYGFPEVSDLARSVDEACSRGRLDNVRVVYGALADHLRAVSWHVED